MEAQCQHTHANTDRCRYSKQKAELKRKQEQGNADRFFNKHLHPVNACPLQTSLRTQSNLWVATERCASTKGHEVGTNSEGERLKIKQSFCSCFALHCFALCVLLFSTSCWFSSFIRCEDGSVSSNEGSEFRHAQAKKGTHAKRKVSLKGAARLRDPAVLASAMATWHPAAPFAFDTDPPRQTKSIPSDTNYYFTETLLKYF